MTPKCAETRLFNWVFVAEGSDTDIRFWAMVLDVREAELRWAIRRVGACIADIRRCLGQSAFEDTMVPLHLAEPHRHG